MKKSLFFLLALLVAVVAFNACKKTDNSEQDAAIEAAQDVSATEDLIQETDYDLDLAVEDRGGSDCPTVTTTAPWGTWPNTITVDYGDACERPSGRVVKGKVIINQSGELREAGTVRTITFDGFYVDDIKIEGTRSWTNNGANANGQVSFTKSAQMTLTYTDGTTLTWNHTHTTTLVEDANPNTIRDNVWSTTGSTTGVNRNGVSFSATITEPLIKRANCRWISEGVIAYTRGVKNSTLDYGNGTCDRFATVTLDNGDTFSIRLHR